MEKSLKFTFNPIKTTNTKNVTIRTRSDWRCSDRSPRPRSLFFSGRMPSFLSRVKKRATNCCCFFFFVVSVRSILSVPPCLSPCSLGSWHPAALRVLLLFKVCHPKEKKEVLSLRCSSMRPWQRVGRRLLLDLSLSLSESSPPADAVFCHHTAAGLST